MSLFIVTATIRFPLVTYHLFFFVIFNVYAFCIYICFDNCIICKYTGKKCKDGSSESGTSASGHLRSEKICTTIFETSTAEESNCNIRSVETGKYSHIMYRVIISPSRISRLCGTVARMVMMRGTFKQKERHPKFLSYCTGT
jgi:hypothetical protein